MKLGLIYTSALALFTLQCFGQKTIRGIIYNGEKPVENVHIVNLSNALGTVSNDFGEFEILVKLNDTLLFSNIEYESKKIIITKETLAIKQIKITLEPSVNQLKEIFLKGLTGNLAFDSKNKPKDTIPKHNFSFTAADLKKDLGPDIHGFKPAPFAGPAGFKPSDGGATIPNFQLEKELKLKRELANKKNFPVKIKKELGIHYFTIVLKIPEEKIDHFLAYCEFRDVISLYYKKNMLELIEILKEESFNYNSIIDKN